MDSSFLDHIFRTRRPQKNDFSQENYVPRNDFEATMIQMLTDVKLGQQIGGLQAQVDVLA